MSKPVCGNLDPHRPHEALFANPGEERVCPGSVGPIRDDCLDGHTYFDSVCVRCHAAWPHSYTRIEVPQ
jgi:hypothetical protein